MATDPSDNPEMTRIRVAQWNQNAFAVDTAVDRARVIETAGVDLLLAQELPRHRYERLSAALGSEWWSVLSLTCRDGLPEPRSYWGVAVFGRSDAVLRDDRRACEVIPSDNGSEGGLFWRRTLAVPVLADGRSFVAVSMHVRPGATVGHQKLEFVANATQWLTSLPRPTVVEVDANSPGRGGEDDFWRPDPAETERRAWGMNAQHGLVDAWRDSECPKDGQAFTHVLKGRSPGEVRFDHLLVSPDVAVERIAHIWDEATSVGADHALVVADLKLSGL